MSHIVSNMDTEEWDKVNSSLQLEVYFEQRKGHPEKSQAVYTHAALGRSRMSFIMTVNILYSLQRPPPPTGEPAYLL